MGLQADTSRIEPAITLVRLVGALTMEEADELSSLIHGLLDVGEKKIILDLTGIDRIDSLGAATLVRSFFQARDSGSELRFAGAGPKIVRLFKNTSIDTLLPFDASVAAACERLGCGNKTAE